MRLAKVSYPTKEEAAAVAVQHGLDIVDGMVPDATVENL